MNILNRQIEHPGVALFVFFLIWVVVGAYGFVDGAIALVLLIIGIILYKILTAGVYRKPKL